MTTFAVKDIEEIISSILDREGGYVNHPLDHGGPTKYGITIATLSHYRGRQAESDEIKALTRQEASTIYKELYFLKPGLDQLPPSIWAVVLDSAVHSGPRQAILWVQQVLNQAGFGPVATDGVCGPLTCACAYRAAGEMEEYLPLALLETRRLFLENLIAKDASQSIFHAGWMKRLREIALEYVPEDRRMADAALLEKFA